MSSLEALSAALSLYGNPRLTEAIRRSRFPKGMTLLLEVAAGEEEALSQSSKATGRSPASLRKAAGFFIMQILLAGDADSYRTFGAERDAPEELLRRHMALILRWLHPDVMGYGGSPARFDPSVFASRVTQAWELIKTPERRAAYHASLRDGSGRPAESGALDRQRREGMGENRYKQLKVYALGGDSFWYRLSQRLGRRG